jgi:hypothetical protein
LHALGDWVAVGGCRLLPPGTAAAHAGGRRDGRNQIATGDHQVQRLGAVSAEEAEKLRLAARTCGGETVSAGPREEGQGGAASDRIRLYVRRQGSAGGDPTPVPVFTPLAVAQDGAFTKGCREILIAGADRW